MFCHVLEMSDNLKKAEEAFKAGQKHASKGFFKKPDYDRAISCYKEAAKYWMIAGAADEKNPQYLQMLEASAKANKELKAYHTAAQDLEKLGEMLGREEKRREDAVKYLKEAALLYQMKEAWERAANAYVLAASLFEKKPEAGLEFLDKACAVFEDNKVGALSEATFNKCINYCLKAELYTEAIGFLERESALFEQVVASAQAGQDMSGYEKLLHRNVLSMVVIWFATGEYAKAVARFREWEGKAGFAGTPEWQVALGLVSAYERRDREQLALVLKADLLKYLNNQVARLVRRIQFSDEVCAEAPTAGVPADAEEPRADAAEVDLS